MGRQLPWAKKPENGPAQKKIPKPVTEKIVQAADSFTRKPKSNIRGDQIEDVPSTPPPDHKRLTSRSPSTSPPPGPPAISPLRPGYANDDLYIMVEDEFWTVAQSYTAHLHHAEYKRLMNKAKHATPRKVADLSPSKPRNARDRARRNALQEKQRSALDEMAPTRVPVASFEASDDDITVNDNTTKKAADRWRGTTLAGLMRPNEHTKTSLVGLERLPSSTRAARGYSKGNTDNSQTTKAPQPEDIMDMIAGKGRRGRNGRNDSINVNQTFAAEDDEEDDCGRERKRETKKTRFRLDSFQEDDEGAVEPTARSYRGVKEGPAKSRPKRNFLDALEDLDEENIGHSSARTQPPQVSSSLTNRPAKDVKKDLRSRVDEVPVFMF